MMHLLLSSTSVPSVLSGGGGEVSAVQQTLYVISNQPSPGHLDVTRQTLYAISHVGQPGRLVTSEQSLYVIET